MTANLRLLTTWGLMALLILLVGVLQGPTNALMLINIGLISGLMALGLNIQWGYAGLFNAGVMGSVVVGSIMVILVTHDPVPGAMAAGGRTLLAALVFFAGALVGLSFLWRQMRGNRLRVWIVGGLAIFAYLIFRWFYDPAVAGVEGLNAAKYGNIGGIGLGSWLEWLRIPFAGFWAVLVAWFVGGVAAGGVAWLIGRITLGLRSDYFAIATLGIAEIVVSLAKNEQWLTRGVKNTNADEIGSPIAAPTSRYADSDLVNGEIIVRGMQDQPWVQKITAWWQGYDLAAFHDTLPAGQHWDYRFLANDGFREAMVTSAKLANLISYTLLITAVLGLIYFLAYRALNSPWGRMMRAIRDNETAASAMGKNVVGRHLQVFVLGSAVIGIAGAMLVVVSGSGFTPGSYLAMRFTFLIWVMVIVGGSGNNSGVILGGMLIWFLWIQSDPIASSFANAFPDVGFLSSVKDWLTASAVYFKFFFLGLILLLVMRFAPKGLIPEKGSERRR